MSNYSNASVSYSWNNMGSEERTKNTENKQDQLQRGPTVYHWGGQNPQHRRPFVPPELGKPGGKDDPRKVGLSGAGVRWYQRFLAQGMEPDEARRKVDERRAEQALALRPQTSIPQKRGTEEITPQEEREAKQMRAEKAVSALTTTSTVTTSAETPKLIKVAVLAKDYPERMLSPEELNQLEDAIIDEIASETCMAQFGGIHFKPGYLLVHCVGQQTVEWIWSKAAHLRRWKGVELFVCFGDDIPRNLNITIFFPRSLGKDNQYLLKLVENQNDGLSVNMWKVLRSKDEGGGKLLVIDIDRNSAEKIRKDDCLIYFRFGKIPVHGLQRS